MARIVYVVPGFGIHGGIRVLCEHANRLAQRGHQVVLVPYRSKQKAPTWFPLDRRVEIGTLHGIGKADVIVAGSPDVAVWLQRLRSNARKFLFLQMAEELFQPNNRAWCGTCQQAYCVPFPIITISRWIEARLRQTYQYKGRIFYVGNGVNRDHFHRIGKRDEVPTVLVEGWEAHNAAKDTEYIAPRVAARLKQELGCRVLAYSAFHLTHYKDVPDEYFYRPTHEQMSRLYSRAWVLIKASHYDARACAPCEAMVCGTPTARAICLGDDDLINGWNAAVVPYDFESLYCVARRILVNNVLRQRLTRNSLQYAQRWLDWDFWMDTIEGILLGRV